MKQVGAFSILITMLLGFLAWSGSTIVGAVERIAILESRDISQKELILRVDRKIDAQNAKLIRLNTKLDQIFIKIK